MDRCCYSPKARGISDNTSCQFQSEELIKIKDLWFCRLHLPWSVNDLRERFSVDLGEDDKQRASFKDRWNESEADRLTKQILALVSRGQDLSGVVAASDFNVKEPVPNINLPDSFFPKKFEIGYPADTVDLRRATFRDSAIFNRQIGGQLRLLGARFEKEVTFAADRAFVNANFDECYFGGRARFRKAIFGKKLSFSGCKFHGAVQFEGCNFSAVETINFDNAVFEGQ